MAFIAFDLGKHHEQSFSTIGTDDKRFSNFPGPEAKLLEFHQTGGLTPPSRQIGTPPGDYRHERTHSLMTCETNAVRCTVKDERSASENSSCTSLSQDATAFLETRRSSARPRGLSRVWPE